MNENTIPRYKTQAHAVAAGNRSGRHGQRGHAHDHSRLFPLLFLTNDIKIIGGLGLKTAQEHVVMVMS